MIKHQVDDDARDRNIEPHGESPARNPPVARELTAKGSPERNDDEGNNRCRKYRVRDQNNEIKRSHPPRAGEASRPVMVVINQIGN